MFVQIIKAKVLDAPALVGRIREWLDQLGPGAEGWLGTTSGITADGQLITLVRFESEEAARRNSERVEQGEWWAKTAEYLENPVFIDSSDVATYLGGGSDDARFVQIIEAAVSDQVRHAELMREFEQEVADGRPDLLGTLVVYHDGRMTMTAYFTSEAAAREGEAQEMPEAMKAHNDEWRALLSDVRYYDLADPELTSP